MERVSPQFVIEGLMRRGYPAHVAQGFVMNMMDESGLRPGINEAAPIVPGSRGGFGLYQLTGPRRTAYEQFAAQRGVNPADANAQLDFLDYELKGPESRAAKSILSTSNPQEAAVAIARDFLRPASEHLQNRVARYSGADVAADTMAALGKGGGAVTPDQIAQSAQAQSTGMQEEKPKGLMGLFGNPDLMANLAIAFNSMRLNPDPNLPAVLSAQMKERRAERKSKQELNKTVAMLESIGADPRLIELAKAGYAKEAIAQAYKAPKEAKIIEVDGRLVKYDPATGQTTEVYSSGPDNKAIAEARKEFTSQPWVKAFSDQAGAYSRIMKSIEDPSPSGDLALIFNFMKVLDPGSVVREGEFATAANAGSVDERVRGLYNRVISGERLTPEQRADFADRATKLYQGASEVYQGRAQQYAGFATAAGLPVEQVIPDFSYGGGLYKKPLEFQVPPTPEGADPNTWPQVWRSMTDAERREYLKEAGML